MVNLFLFLLSVILLMLLLLLYLLCNNISWLKNVNVTLQVTAVERVGGSGDANQQSCQSQLRL